MAPIALEPTVAPFTAAGFWHDLFPRERARGPSGLLSRPCRLRRSLFFVRVGRPNPFGVHQTDILGPQ
jgi:hypothetical protein